MAGPFRAGISSEPAGTLPPIRRVRIVVGLLALISGFADAIGFLTLFGVFSAHMSGNTTHFGISLGEADWSDMIVRFFPIPMFTLAIAIGTVVVEVLRRRGDDRERLTPLLAAETLLLFGFALVGTWAIDTGRLAPANTMFFVLAAILTVAMGLQTAVLRRVGQLTVHTTFISGMLAQVAVGTVSWIFDRRDGRVTRGDPDRPGLHAWLALGVWFCFGLGALAGTLAHEAWRLWALLVPCATLVALAGYELAVGLTGNARPDGRAPR